MALLGRWRSRRNLSYSETVESHAGKTTDKWSGYLPIYDRLFAPLASAPVSLLEIGVQNGGSLEIYAKFFKNARKIIGVDISESCGRLEYDNPNVSVVVGDATQQSTRERILNLCGQFDLIIDDGSHKSSDIIAAFLRYFPVLKPGGLYIIEDLCCSYWSNWEGGLFDERSSMTFLKMLPDAINSEHWGNGKSVADLLKLMFPDLASMASSSELGEIYSVSFFNSMAVITKSDPEHIGKLGTRVVVGTRANVAPHVKALGGSKLSADERENPRSVFPDS